MLLDVRIDCPIPWFRIDLRCGGKGLAKTIGGLAQLALPNCQNRGSRIASGCMGGKVPRFRIARAPKHTIKALVSVNGARWASQQDERSLNLSISHLIPTSTEHKAGNVIPNTERTTSINIGSAPRLAEDVVCSCRLFPPGTRANQTRSLAPNPIEGWALLLHHSQT